MAISVDYAELDGWPRWAWRQGEFFGERKLLCAWDDAATLQAEIGTDPDYKWPTAEYPMGPEYALAQEIKGAPHRAEQRGSGSFTDYEMAEVLVRYWTEGPVIYNGQLIKEWLSPTNKMFQLDYTRFSWDGPLGPDMQKPHECPPLEVHGFLYHLKYFRLAAIPAAAKLRAGCINSNAVVAPTMGMTFDPYTLKYRGCRVAHKISPGHLYTWDVHYVFEFFPFNWQYAFRSTAVNPVPGNGFGTFEAYYVKGAAGGQAKRYQEIVF
jgi:hypothetical protein